jgi:hypothetical protein
MWKSEAENLLMQRSSTFQDFCTDDIYFDSKKILVNQSRYVATRFSYENNNFYTFKK